MGCPSVATEIECWIRGLIGAGSARHERDRFDSAQTSVESVKSVLWAGPGSTEAVAAQGGRHKHSTPRYADVKIAWGTPPRIRACRGRFADEQRVIRRRRRFAWNPLRETQVWRSLGRSATLR